MLVWLLSSLLIQVIVMQGKIADGTKKVPLKQPVDNLWITRRILKKLMAPRSRKTRMGQRLQRGAINFFQFN